jgi:hypothetical protein
VHAAGGSVDAAVVFKGGTVVSNIAVDFLIQTTHTPMYKRYTRITHANMKAGNERGNQGLVIIEGLERS